MTTLAIICGASEFPRHPGLTGNRAFAFSARRVGELLREKAEIAAEDVLFLFDSDKDVALQVDEIAEFLETRPHAARAIFYYVGHGIFGDDNAYYLTLKGTRERRELFTSFRVQSLAHIFGNFFAGKQLVLVLDCCFSGEAVASFMAPAADLVEAKVYSAFPEAGTALLVAASKDDAAIAPAGAALTMFSEGLVRVLETGIAGAPDRVSLSQVGTAIRTYLQAKYGFRAVLPQVHSPRQCGVDVAAVQIFANAAQAPATVETSALPPDTAAEPPPQMPAKKPYLHWLPLEVRLLIFIVLVVSAFWAVEIVFPKAPTKITGVPLPPPLAAAAPIAAVAPGAAAPVPQAPRWVRNDAMLIPFDAGSPRLPEGAAPLLDQLTARTKGDANLIIQVLCYAPGGMEAQELSRARRLSLSRCLEVRQYLMDAGVKSTRIDLRALGNKFEGEPGDRADIVIRRM